MKVQNTRTSLKRKMIINESPKYVFAYQASGMTNLTNDARENLKRGKLDESHSEVQI